MNYRITLLAALLVFGVRDLLSARVSDYFARPPEWFRTDEGRNLTRNILSWQASTGSWPKNTDTTRPCDLAPEKLQGTFDNGATTGELRYLARAIKAADDSRCREAFLKGVDHILRAQYPTGGWPQYYPPGKQYHRHITFNDNSMVRLMQFLVDVSKSGEFSFVDQPRREAARKAVDRGIECILKCQVRVKGELTVWCAQHDEITLEPRPARTFELVSLSGAESAGILDFLMTVEKPGPALIRAVDAGVKWFESARISGIRQTNINGDKKVMADQAAPPLWARFYEIETNRPIFSGRDGIRKYSLAEIEAERRNGYAWYGNWGRDLPAKHKQWKIRTGQI